MSIDIHAERQTPPITPMCLKITTADAVALIKEIISTGKFGGRYELDNPLLGSYANDVDAKLAVIAAGNLTTLPLEIKNHLGTASAHNRAITIEANDEKVWSPTRLAPIIRISWTEIDEPTIVWPTAFAEETFKRLEVPFSRAQYNRTRAALMHKKTSSLLDFDDTGAYQRLHNLAEYAMQRHGSSANILSY
jgi:hypothetical protein